MSQIGVFVLDTTTGRPAAGVPVRLERMSGRGGWRGVAEGVTDASGCIDRFLPGDEMLPLGDYRLVYDTRRYFEGRGVPFLYPRISIDIIVDSGRRYVLPLLLSPFSYSTYRGS